MGEELSDLETFWEEVLSGVPDKTRKAIADLESEERQAVILHLHRMAKEEGWHPSQRQSAQAALDALVDEG